VLPSKHEEPPRRDSVVDGPNETRSPASFGLTCNLILNLKARQALRRATFVLRSCSAAMPFHRERGHERDRPHCRPDLERTRSLSAARKFAIEQRLMRTRGRLTMPPATRPLQAIKIGARHVARRFALSMDRARAVARGSP